MSTPAIFWDRDDTLIRDPGYLRDPDQVELLPGAPEALRRTAEAGYQNIIVTNQSGVARGLMDEAVVGKVHERLRELLSEAGASIDAIYYCPYLAGEEAVVEAYRKDSDLRKPKPGMLLQAALERKIDLAGSWSIGNSVRDAQAGRAAGCRTILIANGDPAEPAQRRHAAVDFVARSIGEAVDLVLKHTRSAASSAAAGSALPADANATLQEILGFLRMFDRRSKVEEFSLGRLAAAITQLMALGALVWAVLGTIWDEALGAQMIHLLYAMVMQLIALTLFVASSKR